MDTRQVKNVTYILIVTHVSCKFPVISPFFETRVSDIFKPKPTFYNWENCTIVFSNLEMESSILAIICSPCKPLKPLPDDKF